MDGDEERGEDQAFVPFDYQSGKYLIDDEVRLIFSRKRSGVNLTCFIDCCHSGTITRIFGPGAPSFGPGERARFLKLTPSEKDRYREFRSGHPVPRAQAGFYATAFAACQDDQVAMENSGQGDFTRRAVPLLRTSFRKLSHADFQQRVTAAFGSAPRQNPKLDCDPACTTDILLGCAKGISNGATAAPSGRNEIVENVQSGLRKMIDELDRLS
jgi:hypothetical protein